MLEIKDSVAVITGGSGGIGRSLAEYWLSKGGKVLLADVAEEALEKTKKELQGDVATIVCDITNEEDCAEMADLAIAQTKKAGSFVFPGIGKLVKDRRKARMGRNPATGEPIKIAAKTVVKMRISKSCKEAIVPPKK